MRALQVGYNISIPERLIQNGFSLRFDSRTSCSVFGDQILANIVFFIPILHENWIEWVVLHWLECDVYSYIKTDDLVFTVPATDVLPPLVLLNHLRYFEMVYLND